MALQLVDCLSADTLNLNWPGWVAEYRFHPPRRWRFDFAHPVRRLAIEIEGGIYRGGRHTSITGFENDAEKYNQAAITGWVLLRYSTGMVRRGDLWRDLDRLFKQPKG